MSASRSRILLGAGLLAVAALGMVLRCVNLHHPPLNVDEAESAINALTILQLGYPSDEYLGLPLFENTLTRPWPEHPEYEFRDTSYSDRGMAIYHGWLPLYAIAASFAAAGVEPDEAAQPPRVLHDAGEMRRRTVAARLPSVLFGGAFVAVVYFAVRDMLGTSAAPVALIVASLAEPCVRVARLARYYSATLLVSTLCCWAVWGVCRRGRWIEFLLAAAALSAAFHTHVLTFVVGGAALAVSAPWWLRRRGAWVRGSVLVAIIVTATVPWAVLVGFPGSSTRIPAARSLMVAEDIILYLREHLPLVMLTIGAAVVLLITAPRVADRLSPRLTGPFAGHRAAIALILAWLLIGSLAFILLVPASSAFLWRMTLPVQGPAIMLGAVLVAGAAAVVLRERGGWAAAAIVLVALVARPEQMLARFRTPPPLQREPLYAAIEHLRSLPIDADTKLYAIPFQHFPLAFYTGLPVQSIAPVRETFLTQYRGDVILIDPVPRRQRVPQELIASTAVEMGVKLSQDELDRWQGRLWTRPLREDLAGQVAGVEPELEPLPEHIAQAVARARKLPMPPDDPGRWQNPAIFRGYESYHRADFWPMFFYRFVDPRLRSGRHLNYAPRMHNATASVLPGGWVVYHSPGTGDPRSGK
jgi:hypothetical protein